MVTLMTMTKVATISFIFSQAFTAITTGIYFATALKFIENNG